MQKSEDIGIGTKLIGVSDEEEISRTEELSAIDRNWTKVVNRSGEASVDAMVFRDIKGQSLRFRNLRLEIIVTGRMEQSRYFEPTICDECGKEIESWDYAIWSGDKKYCMECGRSKYSEPVIEGDLLMCTRCGEDISEDDDIWGFPESDSLIDQCMCSRCAYITHRLPVWERYLKDT